MNILIFGATGKTGRELITQGLQLGHHVTAFARNPKALQIKDKNLVIVQGDISNSDQVGKAIKGQNAVISVLGNKSKSALWKSNTMISDGVKNIISEMKRSNLKRFLFVASFGVNENIFFPEKLFLRTFLKNVFADIPRQEKLIKESGLDYTIVHPARLINSPKSGKYKEGEDLHVGPFSKISRKDVADFLLKNVTSPAFLRKTVTIKI